VNPAAAEAQARRTFNTWAELARALKPGSFVRVLRDSGYRQLAVVIWAKEDRVRVKRWCANIGRFTTEPETVPISRVTMTNDRPEELPLVQTGPASLFG